MAGRRVAVVGAGLAGLSAAVELAREGLEVEVFERSRLLGGKATSFTVEGVEVDNGQHVFLGCCTEWLDFARGLGFGQHLRLQPRFRVVLLSREGPPVELRAADLPSPWHLLPVLLRHGRLGWRGRFQLASALLRTDGACRPGETFGGWLRRHRQGEATRRYFWNPFLVPALNAQLEEVAAEAATFVVNTAFRKDPGACRIGYTAVPLVRIAEAAAAHASAVHLRTPVSALVLADASVRGLKLNDGREREFEAVVLAVPPAAARRLLGAPERFGVRGLEEFQVRPIVDVHLWFDQASFGFDFAAVLDSPVQWVFEKGDGYLCCSLSAAGALLSCPEAELVQLCHRELVQVLPRLSSARLRRSAATRDPDATFLSSPGLRRPGAATRLPNLVLAGAWTDTGWPATMESAVRSGRAAARLLAAKEDRNAA